MLWKTIRDHDTLFVLAELTHFLGIGMLVFKLQARRSVAGRQGCTHMGPAEGATVGPKMR